MYSGRFQTLMSLREAYMFEGLLHPVVRGFLPVPGGVWSDDVPLPRLFGAPAQEGVEEVLARRPRYDLWPETGYFELEPKR